MHTQKSPAPLTPMDSILKPFNISFLLRNVFSGIFFVIAYFVASHHDPQEFSKIDGTTLLSIVLPVSLFAGVTSYGILRSLIYPFLEFFFDSDCGKALRKCWPLIGASTKSTLLWRWVQNDIDMKFNPKQLKEINGRFNDWSDLIYLQYNSVCCIAFGAWVGSVIDPGKHCLYWPLIFLAVALFLGAIVSNWRHHSVLDHVRNLPR